MYCSVTFALLLETLKAQPKTSHVFLLIHASIIDTKWLQNILLGSEVTAFKWLTKIWTFLKFRGPPFFLKYMSQDYLLWTLQPYKKQWAVIYLAYKISAPCKMVMDTFCTNLNYRRRFQKVESAESFKIHPWNLFFLLYPSLSLRCSLFSVKVVILCPGGHSINKVMPALIEDIVKGMTEGVLSRKQIIV